MYEVNERLIIKCPECKLAQTVTSEIFKKNKGKFCFTESCKYFLKGKKQSQYDAS